MKKALEMSGLAPRDIDYINAHGTGTENNDLSEGTAIKRVFGDNIPDFSSTKSFTGHALGAAAGIEAVFSVLSIVHGIVFPNLNFNEPIPDLGMSPCTGIIEKDVKNVLSNSFGFGGNNTSLIFSK
jgi:3-oxoacyl-[acyl-carrier-protein] synthase-1